MAECQSCSAKSQLFLCPRHVDELRDTLKHLPKWIGHLAESALGQARLGEAGKRMKGDEQPMRLNLKASRLLDDVHNTLATWIRHLCESRGMETPALKREADLCGWLHANASAIAADEAAGECFRDVDAIVARIERAINRPFPPRLCGPCPTITGKSEQCGMALHAARDAIEVTCPQCRITHNVERLEMALWNLIDGRMFTIAELSGVVLPRLDEHVARGTLWHWAEKKRINPVGYQAGQPMFRLSDVRKCRDEMRKRYSRNAPKILTNA